jgi:hypothetical protein
MSLATSVLLAALAAAPSGSPRRAAETRRWDEVNAARARAGLLPRKAPPARGDRLRVLTPARALQAAAPRGPEVYEVETSPEGAVTMVPAPASPRAPAPAAPAVARPASAIPGPAPATAGPAPRRGAPATVGLAALVHGAAREIGRRAGPRPGPRVSVEAPSLAVGVAGAELELALLARAGSSTFLLAGESVAARH